MASRSAEQQTWQPGAVIDRRWFEVDAEGLIQGRLATEVARILRGKHRPEYTPNRDMGDAVIVVNADKVVLSSPRKEVQKTYYRHSGYPGGLKVQTWEGRMKEEPEKVLRSAIRGMLPNTRLGAAMSRKLRVYAGPHHPHAAQRPIPIAIPAALPRDQRNRGSLPYPTVEEVLRLQSSKRASSVDPQVGGSALNDSANRRFRAMAQHLFGGAPKKNRVGDPEPRSDQERGVQLDEIIRYITKEVRGQDPPRSTR